VDVLFRKLLLLERRRASLDGHAIRKERARAGRLR
jgi:hypothetical protein